MQTLTPETPSDLVELIHKSATSQTKLRIGTHQPIQQSEVEQSRLVNISKLNQLVEHSTRDLTIIVEAGMTFQKFYEKLAQQNQWLPVNVPAPETTTIGSLIAANYAGPLQLKHGTVRDYLLGIKAIDGNGNYFKAGGKVVKNVAGYDLSRLLIGSQGTLAAITEATFHVKPLPPRKSWIVIACQTWSIAESLIEFCLNASWQPSAIELLTGKTWLEKSYLPTTDKQKTTCYLAICLTGAASEIDFILEELNPWETHSEVNSQSQIDEQYLETIETELIEFASPKPEAWIFQCHIRPKQIVYFTEVCKKYFPTGSFQAHAGNGILNIQLSEECSIDSFKTSFKKIEQELSKYYQSKINFRLLQAPHSIPMAEIRSGFQYPQAAIMHKMNRLLKERFDPNFILQTNNPIYEATAAYLNETATKA
ncbi:Hypothetical protein PBC10988_0980 [Planctomycetales bacterium 10988]|nr:Hypothetical protein PBC10988_0980 [Planctomycetales bacterium 10988]